MSETRILLVEDDPEICELVVDTLRLEGHAVDVMHEGTDLTDRLATGNYDLLILDRTLPDAEGVELCRAVRASGDGIMILMLTARDAVEDRVEGLQAGADDYLTKPFAFAEMAIRVEALLRRTAKTEPAQAPVLRHGPLTLDRIRKTVEAGSVPIPLTSTEFALLTFLMEHPGRPIDRMELLKKVWGYDFDPHTNVVEVYISYLRRKLSAVTTDVVVQNVRGFGYHLELQNSVSPIGEGRVV